MPNPIDVHVGNRIRLRRTALRMSLATLGATLSVTYQQVQKYERGMNRVGASNLWAISRALDCPISAFFEGYAGEAERSQATPDLDLETASLVRTYNMLRPRTRQAIRKFLVGLAVADSTVAANQSRQFDRASSTSLELEHSLGALGSNGESPSRQSHLGTFLKPAGSTNEKGSC